MTKTQRLFLLIGIIALGFALRLTGLIWGQAYRQGNVFDELAAYQTALQFRAGNLPASYIGQPHFAGGNVPGPLWTVYWSSALRLGGPDAVVWVTILLNTAAIYLTYRLALGLFDGRVALWAALVCATSPWMVYESVGKCNPLVMSFFGAALYLALWLVVTRPRTPHIFWVCVVLAMIPQFHMFAVFLAPGVALVLWWKRHEIHRIWFGAGLLVAALIYAPYVWGEAHHGWQNTRAIFHGSTPYTPAVLKVFTLPVVALSNLMNSTLGNGQYREFGRWLCGSFAVLATANVISLALALLSVANFLAAARPALALRPRRIDTPELFVGLLLLGPLLLFLVTVHNFASRYAIALFPLLCLLPARYLMNYPGTSRWLKLALGAIVACNILLLPAFYRYQGERIDHGDCFMASFQNMARVRDRLRADAGNGCAIRIDTRSVTGRVSRPELRGAVAFTRYVNLLEPFDPSATNSACVRLYRLIPTGPPPPAGSRVVYRSNGLSVIDAGTTTGRVAAAAWPSSAD